MAPTFGLGCTPFVPADRDEKRAALLACVEQARPVLEATIEETEEGRTLAPAAVEALHESGLFALKLPAELGGAEADPIVQMDVIEAVTMIDPAAAWSMFIAGAVTGNAGSRFPDDVIAEIFDGGRLPCMAGTLKPSGTAVRVEGGYRITGHWSWGSGIRHASYITVLSFSDEGPVSALVPIEDVTLHDNWHVMGMKGTGSCDYSLDDVFVPERFVISLLAPVQQRGGALYRMGMPGYVVNEHMIFALALARRALETLRDLAVEKKRGYGQGTTIADRAAVQRLLSEGQLRLAACRLLCDDVLERLFESCESGPADPTLAAEARAVGTLCTDEAIELTSSAFRHVGGSGVYSGSVIERCLRDLYAVQSHFVVHDSSYEQHGQIILGLSDGPSMG